MANKLELTWVGKEKELKVEPRILIENPALSNTAQDSNTENMLIHGDNLLALKALESKYAGQVKCIYIDPPYNTGSAFEHYDDNLEHSIWLNLMRARIKVLYNLLNKNGSLWISIDDDEQAYLKVLCDEIFGRANFVNNHCLAHLNRDTSHAFLVLLYAGLRRSELASLNVIDGVWLECETSKERMGKNVVKRKIPITPMMKKVLPYIDFEKAKHVNLSTLQTTMKRLFPNHHSHELRHTFISRCKESGVSGEVVSIWAGHSLSGTITTTVYTHYSEEFQLREAEKVDYLTWNFGEE